MTKNCLSQAYAVAEQNQLAQAVSEISDALQALQNKVMPISQNNDDNLTQTANALSSVRDLSQTANAALAAIKDISASISSITDTVHGYEQILKEIADIASQTNILAINASIEASRATGQTAPNLSVRGGFGMLNQQLQSRIFS